MANTAVKVLKKTTTSKKEQPVKTATSRPRTSDMVNAVIQDLNERGGSSLYAIKKHMAASFMIDAEKLAPFIKKYIKAAVINGTLIQTKGVGVAGSFKIPSSKAPKTKKDVKSSPSKREVVAAASSSKSKTNAKSVKKGPEVSVKKGSATAASKKAATKVTVLASKSPLKKKKVAKASPKKPKVLKSPGKKSTRKVGTKKN